MDAEYPNSPTKPPEGAAVTVRNDREVVIQRLVVADPVLTELVARQGEPAARVELIEKVLATGARGLTSMGIGVNLSELDGRLELAMSSAIDNIERTLAAGIDSLRNQFDPDHRSSLVSRVLGELSEVTSSALAGIDPTNSGGAMSSALQQIRDMFGPGGLVARRLEEALDPTAPHSALGAVFSTITSDLAVLRDGQMQHQGRMEEAGRGTAKGVAYEMEIDQALRQCARALGAIVDHTGRTPGALGAEVMVGDYVITLPDGSRIVVEVKNQQSICLTGKQGVLAELDRAARNREAQAAMCISAQDAFPREVGPFAVYGKKVLLVDDGDGTMIWTGLRWLAGLLSLQPGSAAVDAAAVDDALRKLSAVCQKFVSHRGALTEVTKSVAKVQEGLVDMRDEVLGLVEELTRCLHPASTPPAPTTRLLDRRAG
jgi:hypothetical protein